MYEYDHLMQSISRGKTTEFNYLTTISTDLRIENKKKKIIIFYPKYLWIVSLVYGVPLWNLHKNIYNF